MSQVQTSGAAFGYIAQTSDGIPVSGTIDAPAVDDAERKLRALQLRVIELTPVARPKRSRAMGADDFLAFNQQLAQLASAGLPVEQGLRLIAEDMRRGRLAHTLQQMAADLERGLSLPQAIESHRAEFPPTYGRLVDAGIKSGNLSGTLLNLGHHITLLRQLRAAIWRTAAYPLMVILLAFVVVMFLSFTVLTQFKEIYSSFRTELPEITQIAIGVGDTLRSGQFWDGILIAIGLLVVAWLLLKTLGLERALRDHLALSTPMIAPVIRRSLIARWCDAMRIGVEAGLDLPSAINMAGGIVNSPALGADGQRLIEQLNSGNHLTAASKGTIIPLTVIYAIQLSIERNNLPETLGSLSRMYQEQAEARIGTLQGWLAPILLLGVGFIIFLIILAMFAPMISLIEAVSGPMRR